VRAPAIQKKRLPAIPDTGIPALMAKAEKATTSAAKNLKSNGKVRGNNMAKPVAAALAGPPDVSIVIPIYNEEGILSASVADLTEKIAASDKLRTLRFEVILAENGSVDRTIEVAHELMGRHPELRMIHSDVPDYGIALKQGILAAQGEFVICDEIDLCDVDFYERALYRLCEEGYDLVVGSKALERSFDKRPAYRRGATWLINRMLRVATGFRGTDTHGLKAFRREAMLPIIQKCVVGKDMFASEFVIRTEREPDLRNTEIPVEVIEKRKPSVRLVSRVPSVLKNIIQLAWIIRINNR
jgi:glycosyltransferase involved in cell wall biosynthesis